MKRLVVLVTLLATLSVGSQAVAAGRYCGTGTKLQGLTKVWFSGLAWDLDGYYRMGQRKVWSATTRYYVCRPR